MSRPGRDDTHGVPNARTRNIPHDAEALDTEGIAQHDYTRALTAEALLREHPEALVCGLASNGLIVPMPPEVPLWGQVAIEGRALIDHVVTSDRHEVIALWYRATEDNRTSEAKVRLLNRPDRWMRLHFFDVRELYGVVLGVLIPTGELASEEGPGDELPATTPRVSTIIEDDTGLVMDCDDAFTQMFGYTAEDVIGERVIDHIHPDDQGRAVEGWLQMVSTRRIQQIRLRRRRKDGSWLWVDSTLHNLLNQPDHNHVVVEIVDVSAEMAAQDEVQEREELLQRLMDAMPDGVVQVDTDRKVVFHNARSLDILHRSPDDAGTSQPVTGELPLSTLLHRVTEEGSAAFDLALSDVLDGGVDQDVEVEVTPPAGEHRRVLMNIRALHRADGEVSGAITCVLDVTDSVRARQELEKRATFDALTRCHNRSSILAAVEHELQSEDTTTTGLLYVDLDNFKSVNDTLGHAAGDESLVLVAERLRAANRDDDKIGRLGGDEFLVVLRDIPGAEVAMSVAQRVCASLHTSVQLGCGTVELRASVGVACTSGEAISVDELVKRADEAMYRSKEQGKGLPVLSAGCQPRGKSPHKGRLESPTHSRVDGREESAPMKVAGSDSRTCEQAAQPLAPHARQLDAVAHLGQTALREPDLERLLDEVVATVASTLDLQLCGVLKLRDGEEVLDIITNVGHRGSSSAVPAGTGTQAGYALRTGKPVVTEDLSTETRFDAGVLLDQGMVSGMSAVVEGHGRPFGVINAHTNLPRHFTEDDAGFLVAVASVISAAAEREGKAEDMPLAALHDALTGLPNRTLALDLLDLILSRRRRDDVDVGMLLLDLDRFNIINDSLGHEAGDEVLLAVASRLRQTLRPSDTIARLGGDEFLVVCESQDGVRQVVGLAERIGAALSRPLVLPSGEHVLTASIGIAVAEGADDTSTSLLRDADATMHRAKRRGPGRYELFDPTVRAQVLSRLRTETELRQALEHKQLRVHYQPIIDAESGQPVAVEALVRWQHPDRGLVPPLEFIPIAEETGLIIELGRQVLEQACAQGAAWQRRYRVPLEMFVNVSGSQMGDLRFPAGVAEVARRAGLSPGTLGLEITESILIGQSDSSMAVLKELNRHRLRVVLDDFGTGYSSLSHLRRFPLSVVKVDRSFIDGLGSKPEDGAIMRAIVEMCHALGLTVVAEGVESDAQHQELRQLGCERVQGYLLCRPMPPEDITEFLDERLLSRAVDTGTQVVPVPVAP
jgi:diguanylate cyclase (GGDEF)-like protein/PAS domain S-box-containing protein